MITTILSPNKIQNFNKRQNNQPLRRANSSNFQSGCDTVSFGAKQPKISSVESMTATAAKLVANKKARLEVEAKILEEQVQKPSLLMNLDADDMNYLFREDNTHFWNLAFFNKGFDLQEHWLTKAYDRASMSGSEYSMFMQRREFNDQLHRVPSIDSAFYDDSLSVRDKAEYLVPTYTQFHPAAGPNFRNFMNPLLEHLRLNNLVIHTEQRPDGYYDSYLLIKRHNINEHKPHSQIANKSARRKIAQQVKSHDLMTVSGGTVLMQIGKSKGNIRQYGHLVHALAVASKNPDALTAVTLTPNTGRIAILSKISGVMTAHESRELFGCNDNFIGRRAMPLFPDILASKMIVMSSINKRVLELFTHSSRPTDLQLIHDSDIMREDKELIAQSLKTIMPEEGIMTDGIPVAKPKTLGFTSPREVDE